MLSRVQEPAIEQNSNDTNKPRDAITVVVPVYGSGPYLESVVSALQAQLPPIERIILSHSGEGDPSARFAGIARVTVLHSPQRLLAGAARNRGLAQVATEWVAFIDEDIIVGEGWHAAMQKAIARGGADCIAGSIGYAESGGYWGMSLWFAEFGSVHPYLAQRQISSGASANLSVKCSALYVIGGFPEDWQTGEDALAQAALKQAGFRIRFNPEIVGYHHNRNGMLCVLSYSYILGANSAKLRRLHRHLTGAAAVRWPILSFGLWLARMVQIYWRVFSAKGGQILPLLFYTPGILLAVLAWNAGFITESLGLASSQSTCQQEVRG